MASTPLLGLSLPADGTTNWGTLVNTSITALIDSAIAGTTTLSSDADVTLTTTTEAPNQARQAIILCTGARTAVRTITAPAQSKAYVVINDTTGGYNVQIVGVGPTSGVTIPAATAYMVVWNGADFVQVPGATTATSAIAGLIKLGSDTVQSIASNAVTATAARSYALQLNASGQGVVNVPWTDTTYATATDSVSGLIKLGSSTAQSIAANAVTATASRTYAIQLNASGQAVVNVPWTSSTGGGTVTSVGLQMPGEFTVTNSPVTGSGTLTAAWGNQTANYVLAAPNGTSGTPSFRAIVASDIPTLNQNTTGSAGFVSNAVTFNNGGAGAASGTTFNGSAAQTISYNTIGAPSVSGANATGTWSININGTVGATTPATGAFTRLRSGVASTTSTANITADADTVNQYNVTALAVPASVAAPTGTPASGQKLIIRIKDNGVSQALTWNAIFRPIGITLPTSTAPGKTMYIGCMYNSDDAYWDVVAFSLQA